MLYQSTSCQVRAIRRPSDRSFSMCLPPLSNVDAWRNLIGQDALDAQRAEDIIAVYDTRTELDNKVIVIQIWKHLERRINRILLRFLGGRTARNSNGDRHHNDIYERARFKVLEALCSPQSGAGDRLRVDFR
jgi:hypothetical protein